MNVQFSTTDRKQALDYLQKAYSSYDVTADNSDSILDLVGVKIRIGDPFMYGNAPVYPIDGADMTGVRDIINTWVRSLDKKSEKDIQFVKSILPEHYVVKEGKTKDSIHCKSSIGVIITMVLNSCTNENTTGVAEDDEHWSYIFQAIEQHFGSRFQEIFHNACFCQKDFIIYLKQA